MALSKEDKQRVAALLVDDRDSLKESVRRLFIGPPCGERMILDRYLDAAGLNERDRLAVELTDERLECLTSALSQLVLHLREQTESPD